MKGNGFLNHRLFPGKSRIGKPCTPPGHFLHGKSQQHAGHGTAGGGIADSHFPDSKNLVTLLLHFLYQLDAGFHSLDCLGSGHGRLLCHIPSSVAHLPLFHPWGVRYHADVDGMDGDACPFTHNSGAGLGIQKVFCHHCGHILSGLADSFLHHAVVGAENQQPLLFDGKS